MADDTITSTIQRLERDLAQAREWYRRDGPLQKHVDRLERLSDELSQAMSKAKGSVA